MNYKIYTNVSILTSKIEEIVNDAFNKSKTSIFSEVLIILYNLEIKKQINKISNKFKNNNLIKANSHLNPFIIIISPKKIELKDFIKSKTFQYKITLKEILNVLNKEKGEKELEVSAFIRKLNILFCYYNELGDEFSFINSNNIEVPINIEDETDITIFVNFFLLGRNGAGKSKLINLLLEEMKSIEGGTGFSTTSKKIIVYKKKDFPIRFYDVKGMENEEAVENYYKILSDFNIKNNISYNSLNAIFYCLEYKINGTIIQKMENKVFDKLINFDISIIFIITKTPYDLSKKPKSKKIEEHRENERNIIKNAIKDLIQTSFNDKNKAKVFIDNYVKFFFVNLVRIESEDPPVPVFGIDKILSYFLEKVPKKDWDALELACYTRDEKKCKELLKKNIFLRYYSEFENLNLRNQEKAKKYLKNLKLSAFFS